MRSWLDEIDIDPAGTWRRMGTRRLGTDEPWLVRDDQADRELALKRRLLDERRDDVLVAPDDARGPGTEVLGLVESSCARTGPPSSHPLEAAGLLVQEDLCLLERQPESWRLVAGSVCFPSRWRLADKIGRSVTEVHEPVEGYDPVLAERVTRLFDRLGEWPVIRRNWFIHPDAALYQPDRPRGGDPVVEADRCDDDLYVRSERQTLRRLPESGWILFTIRIQQCPLGDLREQRPDDIQRYLATAPADQLAHRGVSESQLDELLARSAG